jgi:arginyl-tRNA synthetase
MNLFHDIRSAVIDALGAMAQGGALPEGLSTDNVTVEPPRDAAHGDMATNAAMVLAKPAGQKPRDIAEALAGHLAADPRIASAEVAGPGFLNLRLRPRPGATSLLRHWTRAPHSDAPRWGRGGRSMSNSSPPTPRGRCMWAIRGARSSAMRWHG